jgi:hypothetical protein
MGQAGAILSTFPPYLVAETAPWKNTIRADRTTGQRRKALLL